MQVKCDYCGAFIDEKERSCPNCGGTNSKYKRTGNQTPTTIEELQEWYRAHNLPAPEVTRFFIGVDYQGARAFGIYKKDKNFIVYKNKDDGSRAIRYEGIDEAYAVNEIYQKLKSQIAEQKEINSKKSHIPFSSGSGNNRKKKNKIGNSVFFIIIAIYAVFIIIGVFSPNTDGYYSYNGNTYYQQGSTWYEYDGYDWDISDSVDSELTDNAETYYEGSSSSSYDGESFEDSSWYQESDNSSDWDSDSSWDSGDSWSDSSSDWGSDW